MAPRVGVHILPDIVEEEEEEEETEETAARETPPSPPSSSSSEDSSNERYDRQRSHAAYNPRRNYVGGILNALFDMAGPRIMDPLLQIVWRSAEDEVRAEQAMMERFRNPFGFRPDPRTH